MLAAGAKGKRFALPNSKIMIHQPSGGAQGQATDIEITAREILKTREQLNRIMAERTGQSFDKIAADTERDYFMSASEATDYGLIDKVVDKRGTRAVAEAYLRYLYTPEAQEIIARDGYRPRDPAVALKYAARFPNIQLFEIDRNFGGWKKAQAKFFADDAIFDRIYAGDR